MTLQVLEAQLCIMLHAGGMHNVVKYVFNNPEFEYTIRFYAEVLISFLSVQILIARGASLTAENANGYAFQVPVTSNISCD